MKILIVGGSGGVGSELAKILTGAQHEVHITYHQNHTAAEHLKKDLGVQTIQLDQADDRSIAALSDRIRRESYDGMVLLAGEKHSRELFVKSDPGSVLEYVSRGLKGALCLTHAFAGVARERKTPAAVVYVLSSVVLGVPPEKQSAYVMLKHALWGLAKSQAAEFGRYGVRVNCVSPGMTRTPFLADLPERFIETVAETLPAGRLAEPREVAEAIQFLLLPGSSYVSGANLPVTGG